MKCYNNDWETTKGFLWPACMCKSALRMMEFLVITCIIFITRFRPNIKMVLHCSCWYFHIPLHYSDETGTLPKSLMSSSVQNWRAVLPISQKHPPILMRSHRLRSLTFSLQFIIPLSVRKCWRQHVIQSTIYNLLCLKHLREVKENIV